MTFTVPADAYDRFMGRFSEPLASAFADLSGVAKGQRALDVGCGTGALTGELIARLGPASVCAVDPSEPFVERVGGRWPDLDVRLASAESLPYPSGTFSVVLAQLVVQFMADPIAGIAEMARVAAPAGVIAACVWDHAGKAGPLAAFWAAVRQTDPRAPDESDLPGVRAGDLARLFERAGLRSIEQGVLEVTVRIESFDEWWDPFLLGVGPAGAYVAGLDAEGRARLRERCAAALPRAPFSVSARAWSAVGRAA